MLIRIGTDKIVDPVYRKRGLYTYTGQVRKCPPPPPPKEKNLDHGVN